ncbi:alpha-L-rhamnosidase [Sphingomonas sp. AP4-R1]|uniref:MGH1-like glycoside hydrolase domain-containing protein n=1 Tax=Sphingomonas sp. AP4-R1 TaxID=2735134 RepID=UPI0020A4871F|nr:alpha-L-rhamnosidase [Sphingomonas sp. AP4-R1]
MTISTGAVASATVLGVDATPLSASQASPRLDHRAPKFAIANARWQAAYDKALSVLAGNVQVMPYIDGPVLIEGSVYQGIWMECGPHEALVYRKFRPDVARNSHTTFFDLQRADGQLPANNKRTETGFGQIQMVVPIAATAWELARSTGDEELLATAYKACAAWDAWLRQYRDTRGTGLVEGFCTYDTGHDNSPRWAGMPNQCPNKNARTHHPIASLPRLCPDLSASTFGARRALAEMATSLGKSADADRWLTEAETLRSTIISTLYDPVDATFYDRDAQDRFVRVNCDLLSRVIGEHVPDQALFETLWERQIHNPKKFWAAFPLPSVALDDPTFVRPIPNNSWGGAAQALTALRACRWFDHYGRTAEFGTMMSKWCEAIQRDLSIRTQVDPLTGAFTQEDAPGYSPTALVMIEYSWRLVGVHEERDTICWNVRPSHPAAREARLETYSDAGLRLNMRYRLGGAELEIAGKPVARIQGGSARLVTTSTGIPLELLGIEENPQTIELSIPGLPRRTIRLKPNHRIRIGV